MALDNEKLTERPALTNSQDTDIIHVVRGNVSYQKEAQNFNAGSISALDDVGNVNVPSPQTDNYLKWDVNTNQWEANVILLEDLSDVVIDENTLANGQVIAYDSTNEEWVNVDQNAGILSLNDLTDVNIGTFNPDNWSVLRFNTTNTEWVATKITIPIIDDVLINNLQNGQILSYVSADAVWKNIDLPNAGIGGSGTVNYIPFWTATDQLGDSVIFQDGTTQYIGIGQTTPIELLDLKGDTPNIKINNTAETDSGIIFQDSQTVSQTASIKYGSGDNDLKFYNATDERMRIMNNGKIGINETNPATILHVNGGTDNEVATFESTDGTSAIAFRDNATTVGNLTGIGAVGNELTMYTNDIEYVRITDAGFSGFNTTNANNRVHIKADTNGRGLTIQRGSTTSGDYADLSFLISTSDSTNPNTRIRAKRGNTLTDTDLEFLTDSQSRMWIKGSNGRIGIANSNPTEILDVTGNVKADDFLFNGGKAVSTSTLAEPTGSDQVINMVSLTQAEYDAGVIAGTIQATTFYIIT